MAAELGTSVAYINIIIASSGPASLRHHPMPLTDRPMNMHDSSSLLSTWSEQLTQNTVGHFVDVFFTANLSRLTLRKQNHTQNAINTKLGIPAITENMQTSTKTKTKA